MKSGIWTIFWSVIVVSLAIFAIIEHFFWIELGLLGAGIYGIYWGCNRIVKHNQAKKGVIK